jgi:hypothetical protein
MEELLYGLLGLITLGGLITGLAALIALVRAPYNN